MRLLRENTFVCRPQFPPLFQLSLYLFLGGMSRVIPLVGLIKLFNYVFRPKIFYISCHSLEFGMGYGVLTNGYEVVISLLTRMWRNWQTRRLQVPVSFGRWRFDSSRPHFSGDTILFLSKKNGNSANIPRVRASELVSQALILTRGVEYVKYMSTMILLIVLILLTTATLMMNG